jgi:hypothetical protein
MTYKRRFRVVISNAHEFASKSFEDHTGRQTVEDGRSPAHYNHPRT